MQRYFLPNPFLMMFKINVTLLNDLKLFESLCLMYEKNEEGKNTYRDMYRYNDRDRHTEEEEKQYRRNTSNRLVRISFFLLVHRLNGRKFVWNSF